MQISKQQFEQFVAQAIDGVPEKYRAWINNLAFFVEDYPTEDQLRKVKLSKRSDVTLLGLYEGYHQAKRLNIGLVFPDRITLFKKSIESMCRTEEELKKQITSTVRHEIAHHFGSDEMGAQKAGQRMDE
jgi:predicted Zn-dependent protease with MMP-like domain